MNPFSIISGLVGLGGTIGSLFSGFGSSSKLEQLANQIHPVDPTYQVSQYAKDRLGLAQSLLNARMPGATAIERNIYGNQANQQANIGRNATDSSQALALGAAAQGQTNQAFQNLGVQEGQDYYNRLSNLTGAQQGMTQEGDKVYQDKLRDYQEQQSLKAAYMGAGMQNQQTAWNSLANTGISAFGLGQQYGGGQKIAPYGNNYPAPNYGRQYGYPPTYNNQGI